MTFHTDGFVISLCESSSGKLFGKASVDTQVTSLGGESQAHLITLPLIN